MYRVFLYQPMMADELFTEQMNKSYIFTFSSSISQKFSVLIKNLADEQSRLETKARLCHRRKA